MTLRRPTQMASSPPRSCSKQSGWPSLCPRSPAYARPHARASPPPRPPPSALRSAPHSQGLALASALASTTQGATSVTPSEPAHIVPAPPQRGQALTVAPRAPRAMRPHSRPPSWHSVAHGAQTLHRPPRRPNSPSTAARPLIGADARRPAGPLTTTTYRTPEPGYLTLSFASDALLAVLPESSHHLLHGPPRRHSIQK